MRMTSQKVHCRCCTGTGDATPARGRSAFAGRAVIDCVDRGHAFLFAGPHQLAAVTSKIPWMPCCCWHGMAAKPRSPALCSSWLRLRSRLLGAQHRDLPSIEGEVERVVLDAVWGVLAHRLQNAGSFEMLVLDHAADVLISAASHPGGRRRREIASWSALLDTQLRY